MVTTKTSPPPTTRLLLWCSGVSYDEAAANDELATYTARGGVVLFTVLLAAMSAAVLVGTIEVGPTGQLAAASAYGFGICSIDRWIMASPASPTLWGRLKLGLPRILFLSVPSGIILGLALHLVMFSGAIQRDIESERRAGVEAMTAEVDVHSRPAQRKAELLTALADAKKERTAADAAAVAAAAEFRNEVGPTNGRPGVGQIADTIRTAVVEPAKARQAQAQGAVDAAQAALDRELPGLDRDIAALVATGTAGIESDDDLLTRLNALDRVMKAHPGSRAEANFLFAFFIALDALPALLKLLSPPTKTDSDRRTAATRRDLQNDARLAAADAADIRALLAADELAQLKVSLEERPVPPVPHDRAGSQGERARSRPRLLRPGVAATGAVLVAVGVLLGSSLLTQEPGTTPGATHSAGPAFDTFEPDTIAYTGSEACDLLSRSNALSRATSAAYVLVGPGATEAAQVFAQASNDLVGVAAAHGGLTTATPAAIAFAALSRAPADPTTLLQAADAANTLSTEVMSRCRPA